VGRPLVRKESGSFIHPLLSATRRSMATHKCLIFLSDSSTLCSRFEHNFKMHFLETNFFGHVKTLHVYLTACRLLKQEVLGRTNRLRSLIRHGPHRKRRAQQFLYCCMCIHCSGKVFAEPLRSNDTGIFTEPLPSNDRRHTHTDTQTNGRDL
jgi:hypothetical protein